MINESDYYLFRIEKLIDDNEWEAERVLYIIDFVVESDFEEFILNEETMDVQRQNVIRDDISKFRSSHIFLRGIQEKLNEDEVFQLSKKAVNFLFEGRMEGIFFLETLGQYDVFYDRVIGVVDILNSDSLYIKKKIDLANEEKVIGKRRMTRQYSKAYTLLSDKKILLG